MTAVETTASTPADDRMAASASDNASRAVPPTPPTLPTPPKRYRDLAYAVAASLVMAVLVAIPVVIAIMETAHG